MLCKKRKEKQKKGTCKQFKIHSSFFFSTFASIWKNLFNVEPNIVILCWHKVGCVKIFTTLVAGS